MEDKTLKNIGLNQNEVDCYQLLMSHKLLAPPEIAINLKITRTNAYAVCKSLFEKGLISENIKKGKLSYSVNPPEKLKAYAKSKFLEMENNYSKIKSLLPSLESEYEILMNKEGASEYEGIKGLEIVYEDIIREKKNLYIITSCFDTKRKGVIEFNKKNFKLIDKNISKTKILIPAGAKRGNTFFANINLKNLEIKRAAKNIFELSSMIFIYGNNIAIVSQKSDFTTIQIRNKDMAQTFRTLFQAIWLIS